MAERKTYLHLDTLVEQEYPVTVAARFPALVEITSLPIDLTPEPVDFLVDADIIDTPTDEELS